ncbi:MAG: hypothetical protein ACTSVW_06705 [Candidatus Njordarchaeales archaeon]
MSEEEYLEYSITSRLVSSAIIGGLIAVLAAFGVMTFPVVPGVAGIYPAIGFIVPFGIWGGIWAAIGAYIGCFIGAGIVGGVPLVINVYWSLADFWEAFIPAIGFKLFKGDPRLKDKRDWLLFLVFGVFLGNFVGGLWGSFTLAFPISFIPMESVIWPTFVFWFVGNVFVTIVVSPFLLTGLTKYIERTMLYTKTLFK